MNFTDVTSRLDVTFDEDVNCLRIKYGSFLTDTITIIPNWYGDDSEAMEAELSDYFKRLAAVPLPVLDGKPRG